MDDTPRGLQERIDMKTDESLAATRRMRNVVEETNQMGVETLVTLNEQGEKLDNVERRLEEINVDLKQTDKHLRSIEACCGCCHCPCGPKNMQKTKGYKKVYGKKAKHRELEEEARTQQPKSSGGAAPPSGPILKRVTNDEKEDEMEDNLQAVSHVLTNLKGIAVDMGGELDRQNHQINRIGKKADVEVAHVGQANQRVRKQL